MAPHGKPLAVAELVRLGAAFNEPLAVMATDLHDGALPPAAAAATVDVPNVILSSVKKAEDDQGLIVRLYETEGRAVTARVTLHAALLGKVTEACEVDFLERPATQSTAKPVKEGFTVKLGRHAIASVKIRVK